MQPFPPGFAWGTATSAYQIEGGRGEDGKGDSIWDTFSDAGRSQDPGDVACDHYHRYREDVAMLGDLGASAYRFSIAWTRVLPDGTGKVNRAGLDFYDRLVDEMLEAGVTPWPTLYHWDLPQALQDRGGWLNRQTVDAFARYAEVVVERLGDRVDNWITHNEPWVASYNGHRDGIHAPGLQDWGSALVAAHHLMLSHGRAVAVLRAGSPEARIGISLDCRPSTAASDSEGDIAAQRYFDGFRNRWFFDPVFGKGYPDDMVAAYAARGNLPDGGMAFAHEGDTEEIGAELDFVGINYYSSRVVSAGDEDSEDTGVPPSPNPPDGYTEMGWPITPPALTEFLLRVQRDYEPGQIVITENGASYGDGPNGDGRVADHRRIDYLERHIGAVADAIGAGVPVGGYFVWSLLDNLEWARGFSQRFGLVWVDFATGRRIPKDSFRWYADVVRRNGLP